MKKYPRTKHLTYSQKLSEDDKTLPNEDIFKGKSVVVSIKLDGECTSIYNEDSHARSLNSDKDSEDRRWIELFRMLKIRNKIPTTYRLCGENLFYKHTVGYKDLRTYFYLFSIWDCDTCLSWKDTIELANKLEIATVPIIYQGVYDKIAIMKAFDQYRTTIPSEGFVVRLEESFQYKDFGTSVAKFVAGDFIIPDKHWRHSVKERNGFVHENYWHIE